MIELNAVIESVKLDFSDHGCLSALIHLSYGDSTSQGFGGFALYLPKSYSHHSKKSFAGHFIFRSMQIAGVEDWSRMTGRSLRVNKNTHWDVVHSIGHIINDDWFCPSEDFKEEE